MEFNILLNLNGSDQVKLEPWEEFIDRHMDYFWEKWFQGKQGKPRSLGESISSYKATERVNQAFVP